MLNTTHHIRPRSTGKISTHYIQQYGFLVPLMMHFLRRERYPRRVKQKPVFRPCLFYSNSLWFLPWVLVSRSAPKRKYTCVCLHYIHFLEHSTMCSSVFDAPCILHISLFVTPWYVGPCNAVTPALKCVSVFISSIFLSPLCASRLLYHGVDYDSSVLCTLQYMTGYIQRTGFSVPYYVNWTSTNGQYTQDRPRARN